VLAAASKVFKNFDARINKVIGRIVGRIIRSPVRIAVSRQFNGLDYLVARATNGYNTAVSQGSPHFVGVWEIERFLGHRGKAFGLMNDLACAQVHNDEALRGLPRDEQALAFYVYC